MKNKKTLIIAITGIVVAFSFFRTFRHLDLSRSGSRINGILVSRVIDGDTIELSDGRTVRYIGIDTPEVREKKDNDWIYKPMPYAEEALAFNRKLVEGKVVNLEFDVQKKDIYHRVLAYVYPVRKGNFSNGVNIEDRMINLEMVRQGYAMIYTYPPNVKYAEQFLKAQEEARKDKKGLWAELEDGVIASSEAEKHIGLIKIVKTEVMDTYLSDKVLVLNCRDNFKVAIFRNNFSLFPIEAARSPDSYFRNRTIQVYGVLKEYKGSNEIIVNHPSQLEILR
ncbi:MAG: thermonuclease family protein [Candidatus Omnitrophica bacterium]|nr:thermonuclease family protein [Candidatus Omnitrophota bacterium]MBU4148977.1 thermonuclease family protein [Candidatus Omnitrophota bacterium]